MYSESGVQLVLCHKHLSDFQIFGFQKQRKFKRSFRLWLPAFVTEIGPSRVRALPLGCRLKHRWPL